MRCIGETQTIFNDYLRALLLRDFPSFSIEENNDGSIDGSIVIGKIECWVSSANAEYTVGANDEIGSCIWHQHLGSKYGYLFDEQCHNLSIEIKAMFGSTGYDCQNCVELAINQQSHDS